MSKMQNINNIIDFIQVIRVISNNEGYFNKPEFDSRNISENDLFVAIQGSHTDGHNYLNDVVEKGASVIVCEKLPENPNTNVFWIVVKSSAESLGIIASEYYGNPSKKLKLVGITGTNGKTTIATTLYNLILKLGYKCGLLSTNKIMINTVEIAATHTTPDALKINSLLSEMLNSGCDYCFMEVSSHAIKQDRITGLSFTGGVFTNLTHDHLDYHKTYEDYLNSKKLFFDNLSKEAFSLTNSDDKNGKVMVQNSKSKKKTYSLHSNSNYKAVIIEKHLNGMLLKIDSTDIWSKFIGNFNAYNLLAVYATAKELGFENTEILICLSEAEMVEGRFEAIRSNNEITAIVDYAHTPDALENVLKTINEIREGKGTLITVVGCGGDRDKSKRPLMASITLKYSDKAIFTSDNPRSERPEDIINDMMEGVNPVSKKKVISISNRKEAIITACHLAKPNDIILVAGKGHEKYQEINGVKHDFDDKEILIETFKNIS